MALEALDDRPGREGVGSGRPKGKDDVGGGQMGSRHYPTWGSILPDRPISRDGLEASTREVMRVTLAE